jgi:hypothetical protein
MLRSCIRASTSLPDGPIPIGSKQRHGPMLIAERSKQTASSQTYRPAVKQGRPVASTATAF